MNWFEELFGSFDEPRNAIGAPMVDMIYSMIGPRIIITGDFNVGDEGWFCEHPLDAGDYQIIKLFHCKLVRITDGKFTGVFTHYKDDAGYPTYIYVNAALESGTLDVSANYMDFFLRSISYGSTDDGGTRFCYAFVGDADASTMENVADIGARENANVNIFDTKFFKDDLLTMQAFAAIANKDREELKKIICDGVTRELV